MSNDGLSTNEKVNLLFKNFMNFTSTLDSKQFYEETALASNTNIFSDSILTTLPPTTPSYTSVSDVTTLTSIIEPGISDISINQTWYNDKTIDNADNSIGTFQTDASNVILRMEKIKLDYVDNGGAAFVCNDNNGTNILQNIIPSNYASSGYSISLEYEKSNGVLKPIGWLATRSQLAGNAFVGSSVNFGGALFDAKNGIITFYDVNGSPSSVFQNANFYFTATKYVGPKGAAASSGGSVNLDASTGIIISNDEISIDPSATIFTNLDSTINALESTIDSTLTDLSTNVFDMSSNFINRARAAFSGSTGVTITDGDISIPQEIETTSSPSFNNLTLSSTLDVTGNVTFGNDLTVHDAYMGDAGFTNSQAVFCHKNFKNSDSDCAFRQTSAGDTIVNTQTGHKIWFRHNNDNNIMTLSGSNVGIGDTAPSYKLDVNGNARISTSLSVGTDLTVTGNLTVNGTTTTLNTTNIDVSDSLIGLSSGLSGAPVNDAGILINRGNSAKAFMGWDESENKFTMGTTSATSSDTGNLSITKGSLIANLVGDVTGNADTVTNGVYTSSSVTELSDVTSVGSGAIITTSERNKLSGIETGADVTDATNVAAAGAVMTSGDQTITGLKTFPGLALSNGTNGSYIKLFTSSTGTNADKYSIGMTNQTINGKGFGSWATKFKMADNSTQGFIFSNDNSHCLVSIRANDGLTYINGNTGIGFDPTNASYSSYKLSVNGTAYATDISAGTSIKVGATSITSTTTSLGGTLAVSGNVGIGTTTPSYNLHVNGTAYATDISAGTSIKVGATSITSTTTSLGGTLAVSGNVGIGTTTPSYNLHVNGTAYATDISAGTSIKVGNTTITSGSTSLGGAPTAPTANSGTNTTQIATTAFVTTAVASVAGGTGESTTLAVGTNNTEFTVAADGATSISSTLSVSDEITTHSLRILNGTLEVVGDVSFGNDLTVDSAYIGGGYYTGSHAVFSHSDHKNSSSNYALLQTSAGKTIFNSASGQVIAFRHNNSEKMTLSDGNLGIGDTTPSYKLDVNGTFRFKTSSYDLIKSAQLGTGGRYVVHMGQNLSEVSGTHYGGLSVGSESQHRITQSEYDRITLNVGSTPDTSKIKFEWESHMEQGHSGDGGTKEIKINIYSDEGIVTGQGVYVYSDKRIKKDILTIEDDKALVDFRKLNPCTYSYIDTIKRGNKTVYGFISQEVKEVIPNACSTRTETVPNVYSIADISGTFLILKGGTFDNLEHDLTDASGNVYTNISIAIEGSNRKKTYYYIKGIVNSTTIELYEELPSSLYIYNETTGTNQCFVFGQFINNFSILDKNAIWTVTAAATQEIDRQQQADKVRIAELETKVESLESQLASVLARLTALENA